MASDPKPRVILTYARSLMALMIAQSLAKRGVDVIGCDSMEMTVLSFSQSVHETALYHDPYDDEEAFIRDLVAIARQYDAGDGRDYVLMPSFNDAKIIARYKDQFDGLITVAVPDFEVIDQVDPKDHFFKTADRLGAAIPATWFLSSEAVAKKFAEKAEYPVFVKPPDEVGGRGIAKADDKAAFLKAYKVARDYKGTPMAQEAAAGEDYCYCALYDRGVLKASMVYKNIKKFPQVSGAGVMRETVDAKLFDPLASAVMKPLKWHGVAEIDFMWDGHKNSQPKMIEVNPRFWAGLDHSVRSGVDFPWLLYQLYTGQKVDEAKVSVGYQSRLPLFPTLADFQTFFDKSFDFEPLKESWPDVVDALKSKEFSQGFALLKESFADIVDVETAFENLKLSLRSNDEAEPLDMHKDDPFVGLGVFFVLGYLLRYGALPPELKR